MKKILTVVGVFVMLFSLTGCFGGNPYAKYKDDKWYTNEFAFYVANELIGDNFNSERKEVAKELEDHTDIKKLKKNSDGSYSLTHFKGTPWKNYANKGFYYIGEVDDNKPDGIGTLYEKEYASEYLSPIYSGEWKDGMYNGYGQCYVKYSYNQRISLLSYEGIFEDNEPNGKGIDYSRQGDDNNLTSFGIASGEYYKNINRPCGEVKVFSNFVLRMEGKFDEDGDGKGIEYYENGNIKYKGEFERFRYHGDGVLYDENGKEIYDGEWEKGDYKS